MDHGCKEKNLKIEIKKMDFKNITLIWESETNLEGGENVYLLSKVFKKIINEQFNGLKVSSKKLKYKKMVKEYFNESKMSSKKSNYKKNINNKDK